MWKGLQHYKLIKVDYANIKIPETELWRWLTTTNREMITPVP